jgi:hypothetical protein
MTLIEQIQSEIESLPQEDFQQLRAWFAEKDWLLWDKQLEADVADGKLDFLLEEAKQQNLKEHSRICKCIEQRRSFGNVFTCYLRLFSN